MIRRAWYYLIRMDSNSIKWRLMKSHGGYLSVFSKIYLHACSVWRTFHSEYWAFQQKLYIGPLAQDLFHPTPHCLLATRETSSILSSQSSLHTLAMEILSWKGWFQDSLENGECVSDETPPMPWLSEEGLASYHQISKKRFQSRTL